MSSRKEILIIGASLLVNCNLYAGFDFGSGDSCEGGSGSFQQEIEYWDNDPEKAVTVGTIPKDLKDVYITLDSDEDVDIRLYDANGAKIVHWPNGILNGAGVGVTPYNGVTIEYSGYNGSREGLGHEYIKISGVTQNDFVMKAFGYKAGYAEVKYSWAGKINCEEGSSIPSASGSGDFEQEIVEDDIVTIGDIPPKVNNLYITLTSDKDVDIQLYDKDDGTAIIAWPEGILSGEGKQTTNYKGMEIEWSGYNGDGVNLGNEYIKITGETTANLTMKAYGYEAGYAKVHYEWGDTDAQSDNEDLNSTADENPSQTSDIGLTEASIVDRHNYYRNLDFQDSNLTWDTTLAEHAQQWADYLAKNYKQADADGGASPHASQFNSSTHGLPHEGEGENIAWASGGLAYVLDEPVDITEVGAAGNINGKYGAVDMWANEKAYYDYESNSGNGNVVGHYTQVVWQKTTKVGCGQAESETDRGGSFVVCRYHIAGNMVGEKPYCTDYSVAQYYNNPSLSFSSDTIDGKTFGTTKLLEDRVNCTIEEKEGDELTFNSDGSGVFKKFDFFNNGGYVVDLKFTSKIEDGILKMSGNVGNNPAFINLKLIGEDSDYYYTEAEWSLNKDVSGYYRRSILKLAK